MKRNSILLCLLFAIAANTFTTAKAQAVNVNDSLALVDLYNSTKGHHWYNHTNWLTTKPVSTWYGVTVTNNRVIQLSLPVNNLSGTIPSSIGNLVKITYLDLDFNQLIDAIPSSISNLYLLDTLNLFSNYLRDTIPSSMGNLINLTYLSLSSNSLSGAIPTSIGNLVKLTDLDLSDNYLSGTIPAQIGNLINLKILYLASNYLTGVIPSSIGNLVNLTNLDLAINQLSGTIPTEIGNLVKITTLILAINQLSGTIPTEIGKLVSLKELYLEENQLSGAIPASFKKFEQLYAFDLSHNQLSQDKNIRFASNINSALGGLINYNLFTFNGLEYFASKYTAIIYAPQNTILPIHQHGNTLSVYAGGTLSNNTYKWFKVGNTNSTTISGDSTFTPSKNGKYYVKVTNAIAAKLTLHSDTFSYTMPIAETKNRAANTAEVKIINAHFSIYPNPTSNLIYIQTNGTAIITLTNSAGKTLLAKTINNSEVINVSAFASGIYYIQNKTTGEVQKVVVVH